MCRAFIRRQPRTPRSIELLVDGDCVRDEARNLIWIGFGPRSVRFCVVAARPSVRRFGWIAVRSGVSSISQRWPEAIEPRWRSRYGVTIYLPQDWNGLRSMNFSGVRRRLGVPIREYPINGSRRDTVGSLTFPRDETAASDPAHAARNCTRCSPRLLVQLPSK